MNLAILTTLHSATPERRRLTKIFLRWYLGPRWRVAVMTDPNDPDFMDCEYAGWQQVFAPNSDLCARWRAGMQYCRYTEVGAVVIAGSDDFLHVSWLRRVAEEIAAGADLVEPRSCYVFDAPTGRCMYMTKLHACGAGRTFSRRLLDRLDWDVWDASPSLAWLPATAQERRLKRSGIDYKRVVIDPHEEGLSIVDVKVGDNLNSYDELLRKTQTIDVDPAWLWKQFGAVGIDMMNWNEVAV